MKYTYDDIITVKDILTGRVKKEDIIGKKGWFTDRPRNLETAINEGNMDILVKGKVGCIPEDILGFAEKDGSYFWNFFIPEKSYKERQSGNELPDDIHKLDSAVFDLLQVLCNADRSLCPRIKGYTIDNTGEFIVFDNTAGEFFVEDFDTYQEAIEWLERKDLHEDEPEGFEQFDDKPRYVPFDLSKEDDRECLRDKWIKSKYNGNEARVSAFKHHETRGWQAHIPQIGLRSGYQLLTNYEFLDGSPVGKQMASK